jgi:oligopeptide/dipeptide ABC transporter ATP-binding protein
VIRHVSDRIAVMHLGKIAELAPATQLFDHTRHPYTRSLLSALPHADPDVADSRERIVLVGDLPTPTNPPSGCRFHTRCPKAREDCAVIDPPLEPVLGDGPVHLTACLHPLAVGEDLSLAHPRVSDTEIDTRPGRAEEAESA